MGDDGVSQTEWHLSRQGKTHGPISDKEFRLLIEKGKIKSDDLIWRDGFEDWRPANTVLGRASPPSVPQKQPIQRAGSSGRTWKWGLCAILFVTLAAVLYVASPYYTLWRLKQAIENKDSLELENLADWPRIREQAKSQLLAAAYTSAAKDGNGFEALGTALGAAMVGPMIDSFVQPASIISASDNNPNFAEKIKGLDVWSGYFIGSTAFRLDLEGPPARFGDDPTKLGLIFEFQAPGWRVTHVDFPLVQITAQMKERAGSEQSSSLSSSPTTAQSSPTTQFKADLAPSYTIEHWKYGGSGDYTHIEGTTTCASGTVHIQAYDEKGNYLGNATGFIEASTFSAFVSSRAPAELKIKYQISAD
jgi:hypothetical protein